MYYLDERTRWQNFFQLYLQPDVTSIWTKIQLFIGCFMIEQIAALLVSTGGATANDLGINSINILATVFLVLIIFYTSQLVYSYQSNAQTVIKSHPYQISQDNQFKNHHHNLIIWGTLIGFITFIAEALYMVKYGEIFHMKLANSTNQQNIESFIQPQNPALIIDILLITIALAPLIEEFYFRYLWFSPNFKNHQVLKIVFTSLGFGLMHIITQINLLWGSNYDRKTFFMLFGPYTIVGLIFALSFAYFKNIKLNIYIHRFYNSIGMVLAIISILVKK